MNGLAYAISQGLNLSAANSSIPDVVFYYRNATDGAGTNYVMINGQTTMDGISASSSNATITITRDGANLDIENDTASAILITQIGIAGQDLLSGFGAAILDFQNIVDGAGVDAPISIPAGQVARISSISFDIINAP